MNQTENYGLTLYEPNDVTSYLSASGWNGTMQKIDSAMKTIQTAGTTNATDVSTLEQQMSTANSEIATLKTNVNSNTQTLTGYGARISATEQNITSLQMVTTELNEDIIDVSNLAGKRYNGVLSKNETTIAITIDSFAKQTLVDVYTSIYGVNPLTLELRAASSGQPNLCVMTFDAQSTDMNVSVVLRN